MRHKFSLEGHSEGKQLFVRFLIDIYWNGKIKKRSRGVYSKSTYYRIALLRMRGCSIERICRATKLGKAGVKNRIREIELGMHSFSRMTENIPIRLETTNDQRI